MLFYYGDEAYKSIELKDNTLYYIAYYAEPDGKGEYAQRYVNLEKSLKTVKNNLKEKKIDCERQNVLSQRTVLKWWK